MKSLLTAIFAVAAFLFFFLSYPYHLVYHEQYQLFQFTSEYAAEVLSAPAGVAEYLSRYTIQWWRIFWVGAACMAALITAIQPLTWRMMHTKATWAYPLSFVPAAAMWMFLCDENAMPTAAYAVIIAQLCTLAVGAISSLNLRLALTVIGTPVVYILCGPIGLAIYPLTLIVKEFSLNRNHLAPKVIASVLAVGAIIISLIAARHLFNFTLERLEYGLHYYRFASIFPTLAWVSAACVTILSALSPIAKPIKKGAVRYSIFAILAIAVALPASSGIKSCADLDKEEAMCYDYLTRTRQWTKILSKAREKNPDMPMTVACLNLALAKTGGMPDHMFRFFQNGTDGLLPPFTRDFTSPLPASEVLYHLGLINDSQRYTFEIQEAIPDFQKSVRCHMRLAETNLINGDYEAARKYLKTLSHTLAYDKWASETLNILGDENAINSDPEYGWLRKMEFNKDVFFSDSEIYSMLGLLLASNPKNKTAFEYLMAWALLARDLNLFYQAYPLGKDLGYDHIPQSYQEALALIWVTSHTSWEGMPWSLSPQVMQAAVNFINDYNAKMPKEEPPAQILRHLLGILR